MKLILASIVLVAAMQQPGIEVIARDNMSGVDLPRQAVARTGSEWSALWQQHAGAKPPPKVDFTKRMVVAVFLGSRPSAGFNAEVTATRQEGKTLVVEWREVRPGADSLVAQVITSPAVLVSVPKFDGDIKFEKAAK